MNDIYKNAIELINSGNLSEARLILNKLLKSDHRNTQYLAALANAEYKLGAGFRAEMLLNAALTIEPNNQKITNFLQTVQENPSTKLRGNLGISMIVKDEEEHLPEALESVKSIADEIIVVDTGSTDSSKEIAEKFGAKVYNYKWNNDFAAARNDALEKNEAEWVLYIDADERLEHESINIIKDLVQNSDSTIGAYICKINNKHKTDYQGKLFQGQYPRLFRNYGFPFIYYFGKIHEQISPQILDLGKKVRLSEVVINHEGYDIPQDKMNEKVKRNLNVLINHTKEQPDNAIAWYQLGMTLAQMQMSEEALKILIQSLRINSLDGFLLSNIRLTLAGLYLKKGDFKNAVLHSHDSLQNTVNPVPALNILGHALLRLNNPKEAKQVFENMIKLNNSSEHLLEIEYAEESILKSIELADKYIK